MKISLAMIVKNEEENLNSCLNSIYKIVDEIIIVDTGSTDKTKEIAFKYTNKIYDFTWCEDFSKARNFSLDKCTADWIIVMDADDTLIEGNRLDIENFIIQNNNSIGLIKRISKYIQNGEESYSKEYESRLFKKGIYYNGAIHEQLDSKLNREKTKLVFSHSGYAISKSERNIKILIKELEKNEKDEYIIYQIARTLFVDKKYKQANQYFDKAYKLVDRNKLYNKNLVISYIYSCVEVNDFPKALHIINDYNMLYRNSAEFNFAKGIFYMNLILSDIKTYGEFLYLIEDSYLRCLEIGEIEDDSVIGVGSYKAAYNLGVYYESIGDLYKANQYYNMSYNDGYEKSKIRMENRNKFD